MAPLPVLLKVREILSDPGSWGRLTGNAYGHPVLASASTATTWTLSGALARAGRYVRKPARTFDALRVLQSCLPPRHRGSLVRFNDDPTTTHGDVLAVIDAATLKSEYLQ